MKGRAVKERKFSCGGAGVEGEEKHSEGMHT